MEALDTTTSSAEQGLPADPEVGVGLHPVYSSTLMHSLVHHSRRRESLKWKGSPPPPLTLSHRFTSLIEETQYIQVMLLPGV